jgi:hypothetical protein
MSSKRVVYCDVCGHTICICDDPRVDVINEERILKLERLAIIIIIIINIGMLWLLGFLHVTLSH